MTKHISCIYLNCTDYQFKKTGNFSNYSVQATINLSLTLYRCFQVHVFLKIGVLLRTILYYCKLCNFHGFSQLILEHSTFKIFSKCVTVTSSLLVRMFPTLHMKILGGVFGTVFKYGHIYRGLWLNIGEFHNYAIFMNKNDLFNFF